MKQHFSIPNPCSENWAEMTPTDRGAFCQKCAVDVHDFSGYSLTEIRDTMKDIEGNSLCVRIKASQINALNDEVDRWYQADKTFNHRLFLFSLLLVFGMTAFNGSAQVNHLANELPKTHQMVTDISSSLAHSINDSICNKHHPDDEMLNGSFVFVEDDSTLTETPTVISPIELKLPSDSVPSVSPKIEEVIEFDILAYPNPTRTSTTLKVDVPQDSKFAINVFSISGNRVRSYGTKAFPKGSTEFVVDMENLARGVYIIGFQGEKLGKAVRVKKL